MRSSVKLRHKEEMRCSSECGPGRSCGKGVDEDSSCEQLAVQEWDWLRRHFPCSALTLDFQVNGAK